MQFPRVGFTVTCLGRMIDQQQDPAGFERPRQLIKNGADIDLGPGIFRIGIHPIHVVIHLHQKDRVQARRRQLHVVKIDRLLRYIGQAAAGHAVLQGRLAPIVECKIVDQKHMARGAHHITQQLAVIPVSGQDVGNLHPRLDAGKPQHLRRMIDRVTG